MQATDMALPDPCPSTRNATVQVRVYRNLYAPEYNEGGEYTVSINEDLGVNNRVGNVRADDRDTRVSSLGLSFSLWKYSLENGRSICQTQWN